MRSRPENGCRNENVCDSSLFRRKRGRPPMGFAKALDYSDQYEELRRSGVSPWRAVVQVAERNRKTPEHISACRKMIEDTDPHEYMEPDRVDEFLDRGPEN